MYLRGTISPAEAAVDWLLSQYPKSEHKNVRVKVKRVAKFLKLPLRERTNKRFAEAMLNKTQVS